MSALLLGQRGGGRKKIDRGEEREHRRNLPEIGKAEAHIDFTHSAVEVRNRIHGLSPFPGAWFGVNGARIKVLACETAEGSGPAGTFIDDRLTVACGSGALRLLKLQREGKGAMEADTFLRGFAIAKGSAAT